MNNYKYNFSRQAEKDLRNAVTYIEFTLKSPQAAKNLLLAVKEKLENICKEPNAFPPCLYAPLSSQNIRYALVKKYKIYFCIDKPNRKIEILYLKHCLQDERSLS